MRKARRLTITCIVAACMLAMFATNAYASPSETAVCTAPGCHLVDSGYSVAETLVSTTVAQANYTFTITGPTDSAWAVFGGTTKLASGTGLTGAFVADRGQQYDVFAVGRTGGMSTGAAVKHFTAPATTLPSTSTPDSKAPTSTCDAKSLYYGASTIYLSAVDEAPGWGVAYIYYRIDDHYTHLYRATGLADAATSLTIAASDVGTHTVRYWAQDRAGNVSAVQSATFAVKAKTNTSLTDPVAPASMYRTKSYTVYGYLKPRHTQGTSPVRIYRYRLVSGSWKLYGTYVNAKATNYSNYTKYAASVRLPYAGKWKLRTYTAEDDLHLATWSRGYDYVTVK